MWTAEFSESTGLHLIHQDSFYLCAGASEGITELSAFDEALRVAGVGDMNLVRMSSILPPQVHHRELTTPLKKGSLIPIAYGSSTGSEQHQCLIAAVAVGIPEDTKLPGVIMEHHLEAPSFSIPSGHDITEKLLAEGIAHVERMAEEAMFRRRSKVQKILSKGAHIVVNGRPAAAFAGIVLYSSSWKG